MDTNKIFKDVYNDFFGVESTILTQEQKENQKNVDKNEIMNEYFQTINNLLINDDSKNLLKQIIEYMRKYQEKIESNYLSFQIKIITDNVNVKNSVMDILFKAGCFFDYIKNSKQEISIYSVDKKFDMNSIYQNNGLISITDIGAIDTIDISEKQRFFLYLKDMITLNPNVITIISGNEDRINNFFNIDSNIKNIFNQFIIKYEAPDIQELYDDILSRVMVDDKEKVLLLDYISATYPNTKDYLSYKDILLKELSFNKKVPIIEKQKSMKEIFSELDDLVGLTKVKKVLRDLVDVKNLKSKSNELTINNFNLHMVFLGNPGTGKTTVARIVANILYNIGYIKENKLIEVSSKDLVAEYVGQTAPKTNSVIEKALGGVLFIDEAYSLAYQNGENSYNEDAVSTLIQGMENHRDELVVIFAGYTKEMQSFLDSNSGIVSRIGYTLEFDDYNEKELIAIFDKFMNKSGFIVSNEAENELKEIIKEHQNDKNFGNARFMRNIYEKSIIKHASNCKNIKDKEKLKTIGREDISTENLL